MKLELFVFVVVLLALAGGNPVVTGGFCHNCGHGGMGDLEVKEMSPLCTEKENAGNPLCATREEHKPEITKRDDVISLDDLYKGNYGYEKNMYNQRHLMVYE
ncbi:uncharacterized protein LOC110231360 [Exaiptasia diaphana]|uniref:Uncharacterized protein n=1 Tax=Exaiptasia diaphana TaxID=2652724 RepID=A0A913WPB3_EXADI|nr:uncharacterized protein LOC110231360 [Exaiptasia diaphana]KXJ19034.1 hypothetical protein AC249_AIPGENE14266 [Exaiptasia diaphana]